MYVDWFIGNISEIGVKDFMYVIFFNVLMFK